MSTRRYRKVVRKKTKTKKMWCGKCKSGKKIKRSMNIGGGDSKKNLRKQAVSNARKLFGAI